MSFDLTPWRADLGGTPEPYEEMTFSWRFHSIVRPDNDNLTEAGRHGREHVRKRWRQQKRAWRAKKHLASLVARADGDWRLHLIPALPEGRA